MCATIQRLLCYIRDAQRMKHNVFTIIYINLQVTFLVTELIQKGNGFFTTSTICFAQSWQVNNKINK